MRTTTYVFYGQITEIISNLHHCYIFFSYPHLRCYQGGIRLLYRQSRLRFREQTRRRSVGRVSHILGYHCLWLWWGMGCSCRRKDRVWFGLRRSAAVWKREIYAGEQKRTFGLKTGDRSGWRERERERRIACVCSEWRQGG